MFSKPVAVLLMIIGFCSCVSKSAQHSRTDSSQTIAGGAVNNLPVSKPNGIEVYDKNKLPQVIRDYYIAQWGGFNIANPDEKWDGGCSGGMGMVVDSIDKNGKKHSRAIQFMPDKQLVRITVDTVSRTYLVEYRVGGIATRQIADYFKILKDGSIEVTPNFGSCIADTVTHPE